jgi:multimeric flavodoxin WrbA
MRYLVVSGNPKTSGLCYSVREEILRGAGDGGADVENLRIIRPGRCHVCGDGWGTCREQHRCAHEADGFGEAQDRIREADQLCLVTPVYWGEMAETLKCFLDRLRRNEFGPKGILAGKQVLLAASAGGMGNGLLSCLEQMERFCRHTGAVVYDMIGVNRWNQDYKRAAVYAAARSMAEGRKAGDTFLAG